MTTVTLQPSSIDTVLAGGSYASTNYGTNDTFYVGEAGFALSNDYIYLPFHVMDNI